MNWEEIKASADEDLKDAGASAIIRVAQAGSGRPWDPGEGSSQDYPVTAVIIDFRQTEKDGTLIQQNDKRALISAVGLENVDVDSGATLVMPDDEYSIVSWSPLSPAGTAVLYEAQVRR